MAATTKEIATIVTSKGTMEFELLTTLSPRTVANFKYLADTRLYDNTAFHRLIHDFMVQGGDPNTKDPTLTAQYGQGGPGYTIPDEPCDPTKNPEGKHVRGLLSMAKTDAPNSGGSQFFIMFADANWLDNKHSPIGKMISGEATLKALEAAAVTGESPNERIAITSVRIRSEVTPTPAASYPSGMASGLLRDSSRNILGKYQISILSTGALSGTIQYLARRSSFAGRLVPSSATSSDASLGLVLDSFSPFSTDIKTAPLRVRIALRNRANSTGDFSLVACALNADGTDLINYSTAYAAGRLNNTTSPASAYTGLFYAYTGDREKAFAPITFDSSEPGFLSFARLEASKFYSGAIHLSNGSVATFSGKSSDEGGRSILPVFFYSMPADLEIYRLYGQFAALGPAALIDVAFAATSTIRTGYGLTFHSMLRGDLELIPAGSSSLNATSPLIAGFMDWRRGPSTDQNPALTLITTVAPWTPPTSRQSITPIASGYGKIQRSSSDATQPLFRLSEDSPTASFSSNSAKNNLRAIPSTGTFFGSFIDSSETKSPIRVFKGAFVQGAGYSRGIGFWYRNSTSHPILLTPTTTP